MAIRGKTHEARIKAAELAIKNLERRMGEWELKRAKALWPHDPLPLAVDRPWWAFWR